MDVKRMIAEQVSYNKVRAFVGREMEDGSMDIDQLRKACIKKFGAGCKAHVERAIDELND